MFCWSGSCFMCSIRTFEIRQLYDICYLLKFGGKLHFSNAINDIFIVFFSMEIITLTKYLWPILLVRIFIIERKCSSRFIETILKWIWWDGEIENVNFIHLNSFSAHDHHCQDLRLLWFIGNSSSYRKIG